MNQLPVFDSETINNAISNNFEYEIRFGYTNNLGKYINGLKRSDFKTIKHTLRFPFIEQKSESKIYKNSKTESLRSELTNGITKNIKKERLHIKDYLDFGLRECISDENEIEIGDEDCLVMTRNKTRYIYRPHECLEIHLTEVVCNDDISYEMEVEVVKINDRVGNILKDYLHYLIKILQQTDFIITFPQVNKIKNMHDKMKINLAQPETLTKNKINKLNSNDYAVTYKLDGKRVSVIIDDEGMIFSLNSNKISKLNKKSILFTNCVIDAEMTQCGKFIYCFDILFYNNTDLRVKSCDLKARNDILTKVIDSIVSIQINTLTDIKIYTKEYYYGNDVSGVSGVLCDNPSFEGLSCDGFIFCKKAENYPMTKKCVSLFKWKPERLNTIDLKYTKSGLFYQSYNQEYLMFHKKLNKEELSKNLRDGQIIECSYDIKTDTMRVYKKRHDKRYPNFKHVVESNWESIINPVSIQDIIRVFSETVKDIDFTLMRKLHNNIKKKVIQSYINDYDRILDIGVGKGGDIPKYIENHSGLFIKGIDVNQDYIKEAKRRIKQSNWDKNNEIEFEINNNLSPSDTSTPCFDIVNMQFSLHFFLESQEKLNNLLGYISNNLKDDGVFIVSILDGYRIFNMLKEQEGGSFEKEFSIKGYYNKDVDNILDLSLCSNKITTSINCSTITGEGVDEYLVNYSEFIKHAKTFGMDVVFSQNYNQYYKDWILSGNKEMSEYEIKFSDLHRIFVLQKKKQEDFVMNFSQFKRCYGGVLTEQSEVPEVPEAPDISSLKVTELKDRLKKLGLKTTGKKEELLKRLRQ